MKRVARLFTCIAIALCLCLFCGAGVPTNAPAEVVAKALDAAKNWEPAPEKPPDWPAELEDAWYWVSLLGDALPPLLQRVEYQLGNARIAGSSAVVDLRLTAPDVRGLYRTMTAEAVSVLAVSKLLGAPADFPGAFRRRLLVAAASEELLSICTETSVYLRKGGDGAWKIDLSDSRNFDFFAAFFPPALT